MAGLQKAAVRAVEVLEEAMESDDPSVARKSVAEVLKRALPERVEVSGPRGQPAPPVVRRIVICPPDDPETCGGRPIIITTDARGVVSEDWTAGAARRAAPEQPALPAADSPLPADGLPDINDPPHWKASAGEPEPVEVPWHSENGR